MSKRAFDKIKAGLDSARQGLTFIDPKAASCGCSSSAGTTSIDIASIGRKH